ncbi:MAG: hypothetical protein JXR69_06800 [Candidatus Delongbacteria bacterium]|nr:hypothetical protein [Candidatus Delongbacteria bacterium]
MKSILKHIISIALLVVMLQMNAETTSKGEIAVRIIPANEITVGNYNNRSIDLGSNERMNYDDIKIIEGINISNSTLTGWELTAESSNKGKLSNGNNDLSYSINVGKEKSNLENPVRIMSTDGLGKLGSENFVLNISLGQKSNFPTKEKLAGSYKDTINLTLYSND